MRLGVEAALVDGHVLPGDIEVQEDVVTRVGLAGGGSRLRGLAAPGLVDLQVNGFAGVDLLTADGGGYARAGEAMLAAGTTAFQPTFVTSPVERLLAALKAMPAGAGGPRVLGAHLEGPFLSPQRLGAHSAADCRAPDLALLRSLLGAGRVAQVTLAPELPGALELVDELVARGVTVSAGHTDATADEAEVAFDRGVRSVTHLYNAMRPGTSQDLGIAEAALARSDVVVQLIVDHHHVAPHAVRSAWRKAAGRLALVTDAVAGAGMGDGEFRLGSQTLVAEGGVVRGRTGRLAGSTLSMVQAVRNLHDLGVPLADALGAASAVPARVAGRPDLGRLHPGAPADLIVLDDRLEIQRVLVGGAAPPGH